MVRYLIAAGIVAIGLCVAPAAQAQTNSSVCSSAGQRDSFTGKPLPVCRPQLELGKSGTQPAGGGGTSRPREIPRKTGRRLS